MPPDKLMPVLLSRAVDRMDARRAGCRYSIATEKQIDIMLQLLLRVERTRQFNANTSDFAKSIVKRRLLLADREMA